MLLNTRVVFLAGVTALITIPTVCAQSVTIPENSLAIGLGYNSRDSYSFGEFSGLTDRGGFAAGQLNLQGGGMEESYDWSLTGRNLGLESGGFTARYSQSGQLQFFLSADQIPHYRFDDGLTPFRGSGGTLQTLPQDWVGGSSTGALSALDSASLPLSVDKRRRRLSTGFTWQVDTHWTLASEYRHETKRGEETIGAIFGSTGGNPRGALLARPVDFVTDDIDVALNYGTDRSQFSLGYNANLFSNRDKALDWQNPFDNPQWVSGANFSDGAVGQTALEPDTTSSRISVSGAHHFADGSHLSGTVMSTRLEQDDSFLPYSNVLDAPTPLPRRDLAGEVDVTVANLNYTRAFGRRLRLRLKYNYQDRDNQTPQALYLRIPGDASAQADPISSNARINRLYDRRTERLKGDLSYRVNSHNRLTFGYERENKDRSSVDVATTEENTASLKWQMSAGGMASGWLRLTRAERDASRYDSTVPLLTGHNPDFIATLVGIEIFENDPLLRRYHLTDRNRDELAASVNFMSGPDLGINIMAKDGRDDYPDALLGLQESKRRNLALSLDYTPESNWRANLYYNIDHYDNRQAGYARRGGSNPTPFYPPSVRDPQLAWTMRSEDRIHTLGAGLDWTLLNGRLQLALDGSYADAITTTTPASGGQNYLPYPDISTLIKSVSLEADFQLAAGRNLRITYFLEDYESSDWALDDVGIATLSNILLPGNASPNHVGHWLLLSYVMSFE